MENQKYTIIRAHTIEDLARKVNEAMFDNYEPIGGIGTTAVSEIEVYYQAMVKKPDDAWYYDR